MPQTGLLIDDRFLLHRTAHGHPERPDRLAAIASKLASSGLIAKYARIEPQPVEMRHVLRIHDSAYLERLERACAAGRPYIDVPDSSICPESYEVAKLAAGGVIRAVEQALAGEIANAFCAIRPPGHHAERHMSMGFCLLNNVAIAAGFLIEEKQLDRVLILDWDVHHGNGTQHIFEEDPRVLFISIHGHPGIVYPGTGYAEERGRGRGEGFTINIPVLPPGRDEVYRRAFDETILPAIEEYRAQFVLISAGFDAHGKDPLAPIELETASFGWMTDTVTGAAQRHCGGRIVSMLEGGYHLDALADSVALHVERLWHAAIG